MSDNKEVKKILKVMNGTVVSDKMDKTAVVMVEEKVMHPLYKKYVKRSKKYKIHDESNDCKIGDFVKIQNSRPISKHKCWKLIEIISRAK